MTASGSGKGQGAPVGTWAVAPDFCVAVDFYINESTRHAHLILPPVTVWERSHFEVAVNSGRAAPPRIPPA